MTGGAIRSRGCNLYKLFFMGLKTSDYGRIQTPTSWVQFGHLDGFTNHSAIFVFDPLTFGFHWTTNLNLEWEQMNSLKNQELVEKVTWEVNDYSRRKTQNSLVTIGIKRRTCLQLLFLIPELLITKFIKKIKRIDKIKQRKNEPKRHLKGF